MRYLLLIYEADRSAQPTAAEAMASQAAYAAFTKEVRDRDLFRAGEALEPTNTATTVRIREGRAIVTDGPFMETKEFLGGFYLLECRDLDEAIDLAKRIPAVERGSIEIRPIWELPAEYGSMAATAGSAGTGAG